jgi:WD40 repeat protein
MYGFDTRKPGKPVFEVKAHKKACTSVDFSPHIPSMVASVGVDKQCRIWDVNQLAETGGKTSSVHQKDLKQGNLHSLQFYQDEAWVLAAGGSQGELCIWDTEESSIIRKHFEKEAGPYLTPNHDKSKSEKKKADKNDKDQAMADEDERDSDFEDCSDDSESEEKAPVKKAKPARKGKW